MNEQDERDYYRYLQLKQKASQGSDVAPEQTYRVPGPLQTAAKAITMPGRGMRGLSVGAEQLLLHPTKPQAALEQASEAVQPGFQAGPGQKFGQFAGGFGDPINIAANAIMPGGTFAKAALSGAAMGGGSSILDQLAQGKFQPKAVATDAAISGGTAGLLHNMASIPASFLSMAPEWIQKTSNIPKDYTRYFMKHPGLEEGKLPPEVMESDVAARSAGAQRALQKVVGRADAYWKRAGRRIGVNLTPEEKAKALPMRPGAIADELGMIQKQMPRLSQLKPNDPQVKLWLKELLHMRGSMGHWINPQASQKPIMKEAASGLAELRPRLNNMIAQLPGGQVLRNADAMKAAALGMSEKLETLHKGRPGEVLEFLRNTFEGKGPNAQEDMMNLMALDKFLTDKGRSSIIEPLHAALAKQAFAPALAGNQISRAIAGASPFLISAMLRITGLPFQVSLPLSAAMVTSARSPALQGKAIRAAQEYGPGMAKAAKPAFMTALNLIRQRRQNQASQ